LAAIAFYTASGLTAEV